MSDEPGKQPMRKRRWSDVPAWLTMLFTLVSGALAYQIAVNQTVAVTKATVEILNKHDETRVDPALDAEWKARTELQIQSLVANTSATEKATKSTAAAVRGAVVSKFTDLPFCNRTQSNVPCVVGKK